MIDLHFVSTPNAHKVSIMLAEAASVLLHRAEKSGQFLPAVRS